MGIKDILATASDPSSELFRATYGDHGPRPDGARKNSNQPSDSAPQEGEDDSLCGPESVIQELGKGDPQAHDSDSFFSVGQQTEEAQDLDRPPTGDGNSN